jgi:site-specific DNA recombinase
MVVNSGKQNAGKYWKVVEKGGTLNHGKTWKSNMQSINVARVSTDEQVEAGNSLEAQDHRIQGYTDRKQFNTIRKFSFGESAYKEKRDEFDKLLEFIDQQKEKVAVCFDKVDRLSRNVFDKRVATLYEKALAGQIELHFVSDGQIIHSQISAAEKFQFSMTLGLAKYYSDAISDNVARAFEKKRRAGEITGMSRLGYLNTSDESGKRTVIVDPDRAHLVKKIFEMYATGNHSMKTILEQVTKDGLRSRQGLKLSKSTIENILGEPFYYGVMRSKKYNADYPHKYPRLITKELFDRCKQLRAKKRKEPFKAQSQEFVFKGLLRCKNCGCAITPELKKKRFIYYSCTNAKGNCKRVYTPESLLLQPIHDILDRFSGITQETQDLLVAELRKHSESEIDFHHAQVNRLQSEQVTLTKRKDNLLNVFLDGSITKDIYDKKLQEIMDGLQNVNAELEAHMKADYDYQTTVATVLNVARGAKAIFESSEISEKRAFVNFLVQNPKLEGKTITFELKNPFNLVLNLADEQKKTVNVSADRLSWLRGWGSNPRPRD